MDTKAVFSRKRIKRGLYKITMESVSMQINGDGNIIRKVFADAFETITNFTYMYKTVNIYSGKTITKEYPCDTFGRILSEKNLINDEEEKNILKKFIYIQ